MTTTVSRAFPLVKKAFRVWNPEDYDYDHPDNGDIVHAETSSQARSKHSPYDFIKVKVRRKPEEDIVLYNGKEERRFYAEYKSREDARIEKMKSLPDDETYYVQDSRNYVGNSVLWWGLNQNGYTTQIELAHEYTKEDLLKHFGKGIRDTDIVWPKSHVMLSVRKHVDCQGLNRELSV